MDKAKRVSDEQGINKTIIWSLIICSASTLLKINNYLDIAIFVIFTVYLFLNIRSDEFLLFFFILTIFDDAFSFNYIGGSYSRIYQVLFLFRILLELKKGHHFRIKLRPTLLIILFFVVSSVLYTTKPIDLVSNILNGLILIHICNNISSRDGSFLSKVFITIFMSAMMSGVYGVIHNIYKIDRGMFRLTGTISDPNYSCFIYLIGLSCLMCVNQIKRNWRVIFVSILFLFTVLTVSVSGLLGFVIIVLFFEFLTRKSKTLLYLLLIFAVLFIVYNIGINMANDSPLYTIISRIETVLNQMSAGNLDNATSLRYNLSERYFEYFKVLPLTNILFGGNNVVAGSFRDQMVSLFYHVSHNTYIDMLFMVGVFGLLFFLLYFAKKMFYTFKMYLKSRNLLYIGNLLVLVTCLFYMTSLSLFPYRFFYVFALLEYEFVNNVDDNMLLVKKRGTH